MAFRWRADDGPLIVVFGSPSPHQLKKPSQLDTPDKTFWIRAWVSNGFNPDLDRLSVLIWPQTVCRQQKSLLSRNGIWIQNKNYIWVIAVVLLFTECFRLYWQRHCSSPASGYMRWKKATSTMLTDHQQRCTSAASTSPSRIGYSRETDDRVIRSLETCSWRSVTFRIWNLKANPVLTSRESVWIDGTLLKRYLQ